MSGNRLKPKSYPNITWDNSLCNTPNFSNECKSAPTMTSSLPSILPDRVKQQVKRIEEHSNKPSYKKANKLKQCATNTIKIILPKTWTPMKFHVMAACFNGLKPWRDKNLAFYLNANKLALTILGIKKLDDIIGLNSGWKFLEVRLSETFSYHKYKNNIFRAKQLWSGESLLRRYRNSIYKWPAYRVDD